MMKQSKQILGWCLFDVANSSYTTLIVTVAFCVVFTKLIVGATVLADGTTNFSYANSMWSTVLAVSWAAAALLSPLMGSLSDRYAMRKKFLTASVLVCSVSSAMLYWCRSGDWVLAFVLVFVSNVGFALSENFIAAFLPQISTRENAGRISGLGWGLGYFGGLVSVILAHAITGLTYEADNWDRLKWIGPTVGVFFITAAMPALLWLEEPPRAGGARIEEPFWAQLRRAVERTPVLGKILLSCFFFQGGVAIVISFAALYAEQEMQMSGGMQALFFVSLQITAGLGAFFFGWLQTRYNPLHVLNGTLFLWLVALAAIFSIRPVLGTDHPWAPWVFLGAANIAGLGLGATQSCGRALIALVSNRENSGSYFGLWGTSVKFAQVFALLAFALAQSLFPIRQAMLLCGVFFAVPLIIHRYIDPKTFSVS